MGLLGRKRTRIRDLPNLAKTTISKADLLIETIMAVVGDLADGFTLTLIKLPDMVLWKTVWKFFTSSEEVSFPVRARIDLKEEDDQT